jgi:hypothetical protein
MNGDLGNNYSNACKFEIERFYNYAGRHCL